MRITSIEFSGQSKEGFLSYVSVEFDSVFVVKNMKIVQRKHDGGFLLMMPTRSKPDGSYTDIAHPLTSQFRRVLEERIFLEFRNHQANATTKIKSSA